MNNPEDDPLLIGYCVSVGRTHWRTIMGDSSDEERAEAERVERAAELLGLSEDPRPSPALPEED